MRMHLALAGATLCMGVYCGAASAQSTQSAQSTNCPPPAAQNTGTASTRYAASPSQPVEHSAVLPDAGGEGTSAAPTVQQSGKSVDAQTDCPKPANRIDAPKKQ